MMETSQCGNAPDSQEEDGGIQELEKRLVGRGVLLLPLFVVPEQTGSSSQAGELLLCQAGIAFHRFLGRTPLH